VPSPSADAISATSLLAAGRADAPKLSDSTERTPRCRSATPLEPPRRASSPGFPSLNVEPPQFPTRAVAADDDVFQKFQVYVSVVSDVCFKYFIWMFQK
jgi:hypothetical protein